MSSSLLYHRSGIRGDLYVRTDYPDGQTLFTVQCSREAANRTGGLAR